MSAERRGLLDRFRWAFDPSSHPEGMIYGLIVVGSVVAAESVNAESTWRDMLVAILVLVVYWLAHSYAAVMGRRYATGESVPLSEVAATLTKEWSIVRGAVIPLIAMGVAGALGYGAWRADEVCLITAVVMLLVFAIAGGIRAKLSPLAILVQSLLAIGFGVVLVAIRALLV